MRISHKRSKYNNNQRSFLKYRVNNYIRVPEVRLIDENGQNIGVISTIQALAMAQENGLDLVEVSPLAQPPVARIINYSKLRYQEEKERRKEKAKQKKVEIKCIRLSLRISEHDKETRIKQAENFLNNGNKLCVELMLKGREKQHGSLAREIVNGFVASLQQNTTLKVERPAGFQGDKISVLMAKE